MGSKTCGCGQRKGSDDLVCRNCWNATPLKLRQKWWASAEIEIKRERALEIIELAYTRRPVEPPKLTQSTLFPE